MALVTFKELIDVIIMILGVGIIFSGFFRFRQPVYDYMYTKFGIDWQAVKFSIAITAPAIVFHELAHKASALIFGLQAVFHASYFGLLLGLALKALNFGFIFFIPGYVTAIGNATNMQSAIIAFSGPFLNLILWMIPTLILKYGRPKKRYFPVLLLTKRINGILFILNMLPIPLLDGYSVYANLYKAIF